MKDTFDKVVMDETRQEEIRAGLMKKRKAKTTWLAPEVFEETTEVSQPSTARSIKVP